MVKPCKSEKPKEESHDSASQDYKEFCLRHDCVVDYVEGMLRDVMTIWPSYKETDFARDNKTLHVRFSHEGLSFITKTLPALFDGVLSFLETGTSTYPESFKCVRNRDYPVFLQRLTREVHENPNEEDRAQVVGLLYQVCYSFKKLEGPYRQSVLDQQLIDFKNVDRGLPKKYPDRVDQDILWIATRIITRIVGSLNPLDLNQAQDFRPRPGPGATNTPTEAHARYRPNMKHRNLEKLFPLKEWYAPPSISPQRNRWDLRVGHHVSYSDLEYGALTSRLEFVPKTFSKAREICVEELVMQWLQQAMRRAIYRHVEGYSPAKGFINFADQSVNAMLALENSLTKKKATIDMSAGSNRIPRNLVVRLFKMCDRNFLKALLRLSTRTVRLPFGDKKYMKLNMYAPMGSALCFPVMSLVHYALVHAICIHFHDCSKDYTTQVYVYGDDIIVDCDMIPYIYDTLPHFGMKLNTKKSYAYSYFRESCGMNAYYGIDITPTRFKRLVNNPRDFNGLASALANEASLYHKGYKHTAAILRESIRRTYRTINFGFVPPKSGYVGFIRHDFDATWDLVSERRWNRSLQHWEVLRLVFETKVEKHKIPESERYLRALVQGSKDTMSIEALGTWAGHTYERVLVDSWDEMAKVGNIYKLVRVSNPTIQGPPAIRTSVASNGLGGRRDAILTVRTKWTPYPARYNRVAKRNPGEKLESIP
jgi:hypothetical protein